MCRGLFEGDVNPAASEILLDRQGALGIEQPGGAGRRSGGLAGARSGPDGGLGALILEEDTEETNLNPLVLDAADEWVPSEGECSAVPLLCRGPVALQVAGGRSRLLAFVSGKVYVSKSRPVWSTRFVPLCSHSPPAEPALPDPSLLVCIDSFTVQRGQMVRVPNFYYQASHQAVVGWLVGWFGGGQGERAEQ